MDIPAVRFVYPVLVLFAFYWGLVLHPWIPGTTADSSETLSPSEIQAIVAESRTLIAQGKAKEAIEPLWKLHQAFPETSTYMHELAELYHTLGQYADEAEMWEQYLKYAPLPTEGCPQIGMAYSKAGQEAKAVEAHTRCFSLGETSDTVLFMALTLERKGRLAQAKELYEKALKGTPNYPDVIIGTARIWMKLGRLDDAGRLIFANLEKFPDNPDALLVAGVVSARTGDVTAARDYLAKAVALRPEDGDLRRELARVGGAR